METWLLFCQGWFGIHDERDGVGIDGDGAEAIAGGAEGDDAELDGALEELVGDAAGKRALHGDADVRADAAECVEHRQQIEAGVLVGGENQTAASSERSSIEGG